METNLAVKALAALAQETRLCIFRTLAQSADKELSAGQLAKALAIPNATLSFHLKELSNAGLILARQDGRFIYYAANATGIQDIMGFLLESCGGDKSRETAADQLFNKGPGRLFANDTTNYDFFNITTRGVTVMSDRVLNVLFLCTGNSARSIMAEGLLNKYGKGRFKAFSAGSHPTGQVNPYALERLEMEGISLPEARSKSWDEFAQPGAPVLDFIITVCDNAANEVCPIWPGQPITANWGVPDPSAADEHEKRLAFAKAFAVLERRVVLFTSLRTESLERLAIERHVRDIGEMGAA